jgi:hypothetical protein
MVMLVQIERRLILFYRAKLKIDQPNLLPLDPLGLLYLFDLLTLLNLLTLLYLLTFLNPIPKTSNKNSVTRR